MTLLDAEPIDFAEWETEESMVDEWLHQLWGIRPGVSSPRRSPVRRHPTSLATAGWLNALWGFSI